MTLSVPPVYNSFWIATVKKRSFEQFGWDKDFLYGGSSRDTIAITGDNKNLLTEHLLFSHGCSWSTDLRETKVAVTASIPKKLLLGSKALHWALGK